MFGVSDSYDSGSDISFREMSLLNLFVVSLLYVKVAEWHLHLQIDLFSNDLIAETEPDGDVIVIFFVTGFIVVGDIIGAVLGGDGQFGGAVG